MSSLKLELQFCGDSVALEDDERMYRIYYSRKYRLFAAKLDDKYENRIRFFKPLREDPLELTHDEANKIRRKFNLDPTDPIGLIEIFKAGLVVEMIEESEAQISSMLPGYSPQRKTEHPAK